MGLSSTCGQKAHQDTVTQGLVAPDTTDGLLTWLAFDTSCGVGAYLGLLAGAPTSGLSVVWAFHSIKEAKVKSSKDLASEVQNVTLQVSIG